MIKYLLTISVIINTILLISVTGIMPFVIFVLSSIIILLFWYIKTLLNKINDINDDIESLFGQFDDFADHVERIYTLEMFYGDETLESLIKHSRDVLEEINFHRQKFYLDGEVLEEDISEEEINFGEEEKTTEE